MVFLWLATVAVLISSISSEPIIRGLNVGKVVNGKAVNADPYIVFMEIEQHTTKDPKLTHLAAGIIITPKIVLTAAHVLVVCGSITSIFLKAGAPNLPLQEGQHNFAKYYRVHKNFGGNVEVESPTYLHNDIALIWLQRKFVLTNSVKLATLPKQPIVVPKTSGWVPGWGKTESEHMSTVLKKVKLEVISGKSCKEYYPTSLNGKNFCAMSVDKGSGVAHGDSGGPFVINGIVAGIVSHGRAEPDNVPNAKQKLKVITSYPAVFTDVYKFTDWITWNMRDVERTSFFGEVKKVAKLCKKSFLNYLRKNEIIKPARIKDQFPPPIQI